jgi:hypothetical protein
MTNLEKMMELRGELQRLDGIFGELSPKNEKMTDLIIEQMGLVEEEMELLMKKAKTEEKIGKHDSEIAKEDEGIDKLKSIYDGLITRMKNRKSKKETKSIFEEEYEEDNTIVAEIYNRRQKEYDRDVQEFLITNGLEK